MPLAIRFHPLRSARKRAKALVVLLLPASLVAAPVYGTQRNADKPFDVVVLRAAVRDSMGAVFRRSNRHWNEVSQMNTLTQMLGTGGPTQREYLGCLQGRITRDTLWITSWRPARDMKQLQFAVAGSCDGVARVVGTFHTHPFRADTLGNALKEPELSRQDLDTFAAGHDPVVLVVWDVDSLDVAARASDGSVRHPAPLVVR